MTRTVGAAVGALIVILFMADVATRLASPASAQSLTSRATISQR